MASLDVEEVDLATLVDLVRARVGDEVDGAVLGRTRMRDAAQDALDCSMVEAERIVDTIVLRGLVHLERDPLGNAKWKLGSQR